MTKCPHCGYDEAASIVKPMKNAMNTYVHKDGKPFGILNDDATEVTLQNEAKTVVYRADHHAKLAADAARVAAAAPVKTPTK